MSSGKKSLADRIVRQTPQRTQGMVPQLNLPPPPQHFLGGGLGMMAPVHPVPFGPVQHFTPMQPNQPPRSFYGTYYICQQTWHMANNCRYVTGPVRGSGSAKREVRKGMEKGDSLEILQFEHEPD